MHKLPTREETIEIVNQLISGSKNPDEVADWAISIQRDPDIMERLEEDDPLLGNFISDLGMAGSIRDMDGNKLYGKEDYIAWLKEFKEKIGN